VGLAIALVIWLITIITVVIAFGQYWWLPELASEQGAGVDSQLVLTMIVIGVVFFLAQMALGLFVFMFRQRGNERASYWHESPKLEILWTSATAVIFIGLGLLGQKVWAQYHLREASPDALRIEVTGQQFVWNIRYPGLDGTFGQTRPDLINDQDNPVGIDPRDRAGRDDIVTVNRLTVPINREVEIILRSKDVIHSFYVPWMRIKQDAVPGMAIRIRFKATKMGEFEIACAELCGLGHHRMRGFLAVMTEGDFNNWLQQRSGR
jgi:cytochrome c oxidase subunit 2